jgi:hypothetical protein
VWLKNTLRGIVMTQRYALGPADLYAPAGRSGRLWVAGQVRLAASAASVLTVRVIVTPVRPARACAGAVGQQRGVRAVRHRQDGQIHRPSFVFPAAHKTVLA